MRIRLKSDALDKKDDKKDGKKKRDKKGGKDTKGKSPSTATPASGDAQTQSSAETETDTLVDSEEATPEGGHAKAKTGHLVGKINNLVTTDAQTIQFSYQVITLCGFPAPCLRPLFVTLKQFRWFRPCRQVLSVYSFTSFSDGGKFSGHSLSLLIANSSARQCIRRSGSDIDRDSGPRVPRSAHRKSNRRIKWLV